MPIIKDRQTITDIAVQYTGNASLAPLIAKLNGLSVTSEVEVGTELIIPEPENREIVDFFARINLSPAMKIDTVDQMGGIGYMQVETDFIVN